MIARAAIGAALLVACGGEPRPAQAPARAAPPPAAQPSATTDSAPRRNAGVLSTDALSEDELGVVPNIQLGTVKVAAGIDLEAVVIRLRRELPRLRLCFRSDVTPRPRRPLTLTLLLLVDHDGRVGHVNPKGTDNRPVQDCIYGSLITSDGFPPAPGASTEIEATLVVTPVRPAGAAGGRP